MVQIIKLKKIKEGTRILKKNFKKNSFKKIYAFNKIKSELKFLKIKCKHKVIILRLFSFVSKNIPENSNYILGNIKKSVRIYINNFLFHNYIHCLN